MKTLLNTGKSKISSEQLKVELWEWLLQCLCSKESACQSRRHRRYGSDPWDRKTPWTMKWQSTPIFLPGKSQEQRSLEGYSPWVSQRVRHTEMGIRLERAKSGASGLWFQKENSAKKLKLTKNLS